MLVKDLYEENGMFVLPNTENKKKRILEKITLGNILSKRQEEKIWSMFWCNGV